MGYDLPPGDDLAYAALDGVRLRDMDAAQAQVHFERCLQLLDEARDDWSRTYVARLARLLHRRLIELGAMADPSVDDAGRAPDA
jgi:hypothetical protein